MGGGGGMLERKERERETKGGEGGREGLGLVAKEGR